MYLGTLLSRLHCPCVTPKIFPDGSALNIFHHRTNIINIITMQESIVTLIIMGFKKRPRLLAQFDIDNVITSEVTMIDGLPAGDLFFCKGSIPSPCKALCVPL